MSLFFWRDLWSKRDLKLIPNPDFFQYIGDGYQYLNFKLPSSIHPPPVAPILITSVAKITSRYSTYPELFAAHLINITAATLSLIFIYLLAVNFTSPLVAFLLTCLVSTNQLYILYSLDITSEIVYCLFMTLSLLIYHHRKNSFPYILFGLLFLLRYESIVIPVSVFLIEYFYDKKSLKIKNIIYSFLPIILWLLILNFHSKGNSLIENAYLLEIWNNFKKIPNLLGFTSLIEIITFEPASKTIIEQVFSTISVGLSVYFSTRKSTPNITKIIYLIFIFHLLFLYIFPNFAARYYIPIIWILYLTLTNYKSRLISLTIILCLVLYNVGRINTTSSYDLPNDYKEYRLVASWLNNKITSPTTILIYEPWILKYFVKNPLANVVHDFETPYYQCYDRLPCIASTLLHLDQDVDYRYNVNFRFPDKGNKSKEIINNLKIYVVVTASSSKTLYYENDQYTPIQHHKQLFDISVIDKDRQNYKFVDTVNESGKWANIYEYIGR